MGPPLQIGADGTVVVFVVILRHLYIQSLLFIPYVFCVEGNPVILRVAHHKDLFTGGIHNQIGAGLFGLCQYGKLRHFFNLFHSHLGMPGMGRQKIIVKPPDQRNLPVPHFMPEQTEHFMIQHFFGNSVMVIQTCLGAPAQMHGGGHVGFRPLTDFPKLFPVIHCLVFYLFHRRAGNDKSVKFTVSDLLKGMIKFI
ncbi:hypothetical protein IMSAGC013_02968 [Lachnospiraceae bacterium]|nr:hypothetical protein IMSAGC013_02968 [Lachnospiraceae bacterium]